MPDEALGRDGGKRHADAVALGEADETWALMVEDAARGDCLKTFISRKPTPKATIKNRVLQPYPHIPWETLDLDQFSLVPNFCARIWRKWAKAGAVFTSCRLKPDAAVLTAANFAP
jgi:hypothetical protein